MLHGCHDCKHVFVKVGYDEHPEYFCHYDNSKRPICGSMLMGESYFKEGDARFDELYEAWIKWSAQHLCMAWGVCPQWKERLIKV